MGENSKIDWTDHSFNPWLGCMKVSEGCRNCYAETMMDKRYGRVKWGQMKTETTEPSVGTRVRTSAANWRKPLAWDRKAREAQEDFEAGMLTLRPHRPRVFCSSLADVFDNQAPEGAQDDLWKLIEATPNLDWLLLTKRPENASKMVPESWESGWPRNVWLGITAEDQENYNRRMRKLEGVPAVVHFVSYEPAIGPLTIPGLKPSWVICGGESGAGYRDMPEEWAESIKNECVRKGIPFFMKQMAGKKAIPDRLMLREFPVVA